MIYRNLIIGNGNNYKSENMHLLKTASEFNKQAGALGFVGNKVMNRVQSANSMGETAAKTLTPGKSNSFKLGASSVFKPDYTVMRNSMADQVKKYAKASKAEKAYGNALMQGNISKVFKSKTFQNSPLLQETAQKLQMGNIVDAYKKNNKLNFAPYEKTYKSSSFGQFGMGAAKQLKTINPKNIKLRDKFASGTEATGNTMMGIMGDIDIPLSNMARRIDGATIKGETGIAGATKRLQESKAFNQTNKVFRMLEGKSPAQSLKSKFEAIGKQKSPYANYTFGTQKPLKTTQAT